MKAYPPHNFICITQAGDDDEDPGGDAPDPAKIAMIKKKARDRGTVDLTLGGNSQADDPVDPRPWPYNEYPLESNKRSFPQAWEDSHEGQDNARHGRNAIVN